MTSEKPIKDLTQFNWGGMASPVEYDVPKCGVGIHGCARGADGHWTHTMNGTWTVGDMRPNPSRTNELICAQRPLYGDGTGLDFQEEGYLNIPPCVFGSSEAEDGLAPPPGGEGGLPFSTRLFSKKICRADYAHHGEMSLWQTYGELV